MSISHLSACPYCDRLLEDNRLPEDHVSRCPRCGTVIDKSVRNSLQKSFALSLAGLILFIPAVFMPIMTFSLAGMQSTGNVIDAIVGLFASRYFFVGFMVLLVSLVFPFVKLGLLFITSFSLLSRQVLRPVVFLFRLYKRLSEWGMVEVYMLGILVSIIKMHQLARIDYDTGFFCFSALVVLTVWSSAVVDEKLFWDMLDKDAEDSPVKKDGGYKKFGVFCCRGQNGTRGRIDQVPWTAETKRGCCSTRRRSSAMSPLSSDTSPEKNKKHQ